MYAQPSQWRRKGERIVERQQQLEVALCPHFFIEILYSHSQSWPASCLVLVPCRQSGQKQLDVFRDETQGLDMYGRRLQASAWAAPRLLVREPAQASQVGL